MKKPADGNRRGFPVLWKTYKFFSGFPIFRQLFPVENPTPGGKPGGKCGQPGQSESRGGGYFGELCYPKIYPLWSGEKSIEL